MPHCLVGLMQATGIKWDLTAGGLCSTQSISQRHTKCQQIRSHRPSLICHSTSRLLLWHLKSPSDHPVFYKCKLPAAPLLTAFTCRRVDSHLGYSFTYVLPTQQPSFYDSLWTSHASFLSWPYIFNYMRALHFHIYTMSIWGFVSLIPWRKEATICPFAFIYL